MDFDSRKDELNFNGLAEEIYTLEKRMEEKRAKRKELRAQITEIDGDLKTEHAELERLRRRMLELVEHFTHAHDDRNSPPEVDERDEEVPTLLHSKSSY